ncbi:MAG: hypothetical protein GY705_27020, partial [Bacteroidetes bacterium]|nr:hypothetical protein [Bacteroidota bacterium]
MGISGGGINPLSRERKTWTFLGDMRHCFSESTGLNEAKFWYARLGVTYLFGGGVEGVLPSLCIGREVHFSKRTGMHIDADWFTYLDFLPQEYFQLVEFHSFTKFFQLNYSLFHGKVVGIKLLVTIP